MVFSLWSVKCLKAVEGHTYYNKTKGRNNRASILKSSDIQHIIELGKSLLKMPIELLPGVKETLKVLKEKGKYKLVVATKGDLLDQ